MKDSKRRRQTGARRAIGIVGLGIGLSVFSGATFVERWDFEGEAEGRTPDLVSAEVGHWEIVADGENQVLAQRAENDDETFNVALVEGTDALDVDLRVRFRAVSGELDRGGGLVWRAADARNYYIARYNPLEDNFRVYTVVDGVRTQLQSADVPHSDGWHALRVTMLGSHIQCYYGDEPLLNVRDTTFNDPGRIGLWTKADAVTWFDDLELLPASEQPPPGT